MRTSPGWLGPLPEVRIRDLAQRREGSLELAGPGLAEVGAPGGLDLADDWQADLHELPPSSGDRDESSPGVIRVGDAAHVPCSLQLIDDGADCLLGQLSGLGELSQPGTAHRDPLEHPSLVQRQVVPLGPEGVHHGGLHEAVRDEQQEAEVRLRIAGVVHSTILADKPNFGLY